MCVCVYIESCAISLNPTSKIAFGYCYVFSLTEINKSRNICGHLLMSWLTEMLSSFPARHKKLQIGCFHLRF